MKLKHNGPTKQIWLDLALFSIQLRVRYRSLYWRLKSGQLLFSILCVKVTSGGTKRSQGCWQGTAQSPGKSPGVSGNEPEELIALLSNTELRFITEVAPVKVTPADPFVFPGVTASISWVSTCFFGLVKQSQVSQLRQRLKLDEMDSRTQQKLFATSVRSSSHAELEGKTLTCFDWLSSFYQLIHWILLYWNRPAKDSDLCLAAVMDRSLTQKFQAVDVLKQNELLNNINNIVQYRMRMQ